MIVLAVRFNIKPECLEEAIEAMKVVQAATVQEEGCVEYRCFPDFEDANKVFLFEEWESQAHLESHFETTHLADFRSQMDTVLVEPPSIRRYEVSSAGPL